MNEKLWGIHMPDWLGELALEQNFIAINWAEVGNLSDIGNTREEFKAKLGKVYPGYKQGTIPVVAGVLFRFSKELTKGDYILFPSKHNRYVNIGQIKNDYYYQPIQDDEDDYPNRHEVEWLGHFPRSMFSQASLNEIGSAITLFKIKNHKTEFLAKIGKSEVIEDDDISQDDDTAMQTAINNAEDTAEDFIIKRLHNNLSGYEFEYFIAHLMACMGYTTRVTEASADGGVDVIAHNDKLGIEPPIIKIQCKRIINVIDESKVRDLAGTLGEGEYGLFITLGTYSKSARVFERNKPKLRLIDGEQLVELIMQYYGNLSPKYRTMLPLKQIYIPDILKK